MDTNTPQIPAEVRAVLLNLAHRYRSARRQYRQQLRIMCERERIDMTRPEGIQQLSTSSLLIEASLHSRMLEAHNSYRASLEVAIDSATHARS